MNVKRKAVKNIINKYRLSISYCHGQSDKVLFSP